MLTNVLLALWRIVTAPGRAAINQLNEVRAPGTPPVGPVMAAGVHGLVALFGTAAVTLVLASAQLLLLVLALIGVWAWRSHRSRRRR